MYRISAHQSQQISSLESRYGSLTLRTLLSGEDRRLMRPERLEHLKSGSGRISSEEAHWLSEINLNNQNLGNLQRKVGKEKLQDSRSFKNRRALRTWLRYGKEKGGPFPKHEDKEGKDRSLKAARALRYLGVDPEKHLFYPRRKK